MPSSYPCGSTRCSPDPRPTPARRRSISAILAAIAINGAACRSSTSPTPSSEPPTGPDAPVKAKRPPPATIGTRVSLTLSRYTGGTVDIGEYDKTRLLVFFAPFAGTDDDYRRFVQALAARHRDRIEVVAIVDDAHARQLDLELDLSLVIAFDPQFASATKLGVDRLPTALLLDRRGVVVDLVAGDDDTARAALDHAISEHEG